MAKRSLLSRCPSYIRYKDYNETEVVCQLGNCNEPSQKIHSVQMYNVLLLRLTIRNFWVKNFPLKQLLLLQYDSCLDWTTCFE
jgi:hypothetical protein